MLNPFTNTVSTACFKAKRTLGPDDQRCFRASERLRLLWMNAVHSFIARAGSLARVQERSRHQLNSISLDL